MNDEFESLPPIVKKFFEGSYRLEYAASGRAACRGPKPCKGSLIAVGTLRLGNLAERGPHIACYWRHWGCTTPQVIQSLKRLFRVAAAIPGYNALDDEDKRRVNVAFEKGHVEDVDKPDTALCGPVASKPAPVMKKKRKAASEATKKKRAAARRKAAAAATTAAAAEEDKKVEEADAEDNADNNLVAEDVDRKRKGPSKLNSASKKKRVEDNTVQEA